MTPNTITMTPNTISLYPQQLKRIAALCEKLNDVDGIDVPETDGVTLQFKQPIVLVDEHGDEYGEFRDEIGGSWAFHAKAV